MEVSYQLRQGSNCVDFHTGDVFGLPSWMATCSRVKSVLETQGLKMSRRAALLGGLPNLARAVNFGDFGRGYLPATETEVVHGPES